MNTTTPVLPFNESTEVIDWVDMYQYANKSAVLGCWITFTLISGLLNLAVSMLTIRRLVNLPWGSPHRPQLTVILASCLVFVFRDVVVHPMVIHGNRVGWDELESTWSCDTMVALEVMASIVSAVSNLLVSGLVVVVGLRVQSLVALSSNVRAIVAIVVIILSLLYGLTVVVPVFFFRYLNDRSQPCYQGTLSLHVDADSFKDLTCVVESFGPDVLLFWSCFLLLMAYFIRPATSNESPVGSAQPGPSPGAGPANAANTDERRNQDLPVNQPQPEEGTDSAHRDPFPWYVLLSAATTFLFSFPFFLQACDELRTTQGDSIRLWLSALLLESLRGVLVACCWLISKEVRAGAYCGSPIPGNTARIRQQRGDDTEELTRF